MAVSINILVDGEPCGVSVNQSDVTYSDVNVLLELISKWREVAEEPCPAGQKCPVLKQFLDELEGRLNA